MYSIAHLVQPPLTPPHLMRGKEVPTHTVTPPLGFYVRLGERGKYQR